MTFIARSRNNVKVWRAKVGGFAYVRVKDLVEEDKAEFREFMKERARPVIPHLVHQDACYLADYEEWFDAKYGNRRAKKAPR